MTATKTSRAHAPPTDASPAAADGPTAGTPAPKASRATKASAGAANKPTRRNSAKAEIAQPKAVAPKAAPKKPVASERHADAPGSAKKAPKVSARMVRDSFTMPEADFALIATLKARAPAGQRETSKSELLRAGRQALAALDSPALLSILGGLEPVKIGRPKKGHCRS